MSYTKSKLNQIVDKEKCFFFIFTIINSYDKYFEIKMRYVLSVIFSKVENFFHGFIIFM
jgi:hypothetical protein